MAIEPKSLTEMIEDFLAIVEAETGVPVDTRVGSVLRALASANATNNIFVQSQVQQVALDSRLTTATGDAVKSFVMQFSPPFPPPIEATKANQGPVAPTTLSAAAQAGFVWVGNITKLKPAQKLSLINGAKQAVATVGVVQPTVSLLTAAQQGDASLHVSSTEGMFNGMSLDLVDGNFTASVIVQGVVDAAHVTVTPVSSVITHTFATSTTVVTRRNVLSITSYEFTTGTVLTDLVPGTEVRATTLLEGQRFYRNTADETTPSIPAKSGTQQGYRVQTKADAVQYEVVEDLTNPYYDPALRAYKIPPFASEVYVKVEAVVAGVANNVAANTLVLMPTPLNGIDGTTNPYAISNGAEAETDEEIKKRFRDFITSQAGATYGAVQGEVAGIGTNIEFSILENVAADGVTAKPGNFVVLVGDTTGSLTPELLDQVRVAVEKTRAITTTYDVVPPTINTPVLVLVIATDGTAGTHAAVQQAIYDSFLGQPAGAGWNFGDLLALAQTHVNVTNVLKFTINGHGFDRTSGAYAVVGDGPSDATVGALTLTRPPLANISVT